MTQTPVAIPAGDPAATGSAGKQVANRSPVQAFKNRTRVCAVHACACPLPPKEEEGAPGPIWSVEAGSPGCHFSQAWWPRVFSWAAKRKACTGPGTGPATSVPGQGLSAPRPPSSPPHTSPEEDICLEMGSPALGGRQSPHSRPVSTDVTLPCGTDGLAAASFSRALWYFRLWHRHE